MKADLRLLWRILQLVVHLIRINGAKRCVSSIEVAV